jgi:Cu+-exporting ATPase
MRHGAGTDDAEPRRRPKSGTDRLHAALLGERCASIPLLILTMGPMFGLPIRDWIGERAAAWLELVLATPVVLWAAIPFFRRGWASIVNRSPNMWTLIAIGVGAAYSYSVIATLVP